MKISLFLWGLISEVWDKGNCAVIVFRFLNLNSKKGHLDLSSGWLFWFDQRGTKGKSSSEYNPWNYICKREVAYANEHVRVLKSLNYQDSSHHKILWRTCDKDVNCVVRKLQKSFLEGHFTKKRFALLSQMSVKCVDNNWFFKKSSMANVTDFYLALSVKAFFKAVALYHPPWFT